MWASIRVIRQRGWSFDDEEHAPGTRCVAATLYDEHAEPLAAISPDIAEIVARARGRASGTADGQIMFSRRASRGRSPQPGW